MTLMQENKNSSAWSLAKVLGWVMDHVFKLWTACVLTILALSLIPPGEWDDIGNSWVWNYGHIVGYVALTALTVLLARSRTSMTWRLRFALYGAIIALGIAIELVQPYVGRHGDIQDALSDALGVAIGACFELLILRSNETSRIAAWRSLD